MTRKQNLTLKVKKARIFVKNVPTFLNFSDFLTRFF